MGERAKRESNKIQLLQSAWRQRIITRVLNDGLIASELLQRLHNPQQPGAEFGPYLGSNDFAPMKWLAGCSILTPAECADTGAWGNLPNPFVSHLADRFYLGEMSIFPVLLERPWERRLHYADHYEGKDIDHVLSGFQQRVVSSFLVVAELTQELTDKKVCWLYPEKFKTVMFPRDIWNDHIANTDGSIPPLPFVIIDKQVTKTIGTVPKFLNLPDYESQLKKLVELEQKSLWIHAVRLPTEEDVEKLIPDQTS